MLKKFLRSAQTFFPGFQDFRFRTHSRLLHALDRPYRPEYRGIRAFQVKEPLFVDIGANRGMSVGTMRTMKPDARIIGFEPNYHLARKLRQTFEKDPNVRVEPFGLGDKVGEMTLYIPVYRGYRFDGLASIHRQNAQDWLNSDRIVGFDQSQLAIEEMRVQIRTLDEFELAPFLIKLYVQGYEQEVITGAKNTIEKHQPVILAPGKNERVDVILRRFGYGRYSWIRNEFVSEADRGFVVFYMTAAQRRLVAEQFRLKLNTMQPR
jgi:FkbM family methyltransferase